MAKSINKEPKVSIVFLNWNAKKHTFELIESLKKIKYKNFDIIVSDNGSTDGIEKEFKKKYGKIGTLIENKRNLGEDEGLNVGIREALKRNSDYVLIMDNDMYVDKDFLNILVNEMEKQTELAVVGPKIYYTQPADNIIWSAGCDHHFRGFRSRHQGDDCVLLMRASVLRKEGVLNGEFFTMHEMTGWCHRVSKRGYKIMYVPRAKIWHKVSTSLNMTPNKKEIITYYDIRNWLLSNKYNENVLYFMWILFLQSTVFFAIRSAKYIRDKQPKLMKTYWIAIWHALINKTPIELYPYKKSKN
ncbi:glycosyltransferase family 2 protein [Candidatus Pacearchaeota archaeon]|nr:glycosyltransferase family 2 protein [Candidatus Pacearchaeota archaeon]